MDIKETVKAFDQYLAKKNNSFEAVIVGGPALNLLSITERVTRDIDVLDPRELPEEIKTLAETFAEENVLPLAWLNTGLSDLLDHLPDGWQSRLREVFRGNVIVLKTLGRLDLLMTKCWAYCDRERDFDDIIAMTPSERELEETTEWLLPLDANPAWPNYVKERMVFIAESLRGNKNE